METLVKTSVGFLHITVSQDLNIGQAIAKTAEVAKTMDKFYQRKTTPKDKK